MPRLESERPDQRPPLLKKAIRAKSVISGLVKKKKITMSISVLMPSAKAKPRTTPMAKM